MTRLDVHVEAAASALEPVTAVLVDGGNAEAPSDECLRELELLLDWGPQPTRTERPQALPRLALLGHSRLPDGTTVITGALDTRRLRCIRYAPGSRPSEQPPVHLWGSEVWNEVAPEPGVETARAFSLDALESFAIKHHGELAVFLTAVRSLFLAPAGRQLLVSAGEQDVARWIALASKSLPVELGNSLTFVTWARDPWRMPQQIIGVDQESEFDRSLPTLSHYFRLHCLDDTAPGELDPWADLAARAWLAGRPDLLHSGSAAVADFFDSALLLERLLRENVHLPEEAVRGWAASWTGQPDRLALLPRSALDRVIGELAAETGIATSEQQAAERVRVCRRLAELRAPEVVAPLTEALVRRWLDAVLERPASTSHRPPPDLPLPQSTLERLRIEYVDRFVRALLRPGSRDERTQLRHRAVEVGPFFADAILGELNDRLNQPGDYDQVVNFAATPAGAWLDEAGVPDRLQVVRRYVLAHGRGADRTALFQELIHSAAREGSGDPEVTRLAWRLVWPRNAISEQDAAAVAEHGPAALIAAAELTGVLAAVLDSPDPVALERCRLAGTLLRNHAFHLTDQQRARAQLLVTAHEVAVGHVPADGAANTLRQLQEAAGVTGGSVARFCQDMLAASLYRGDHTGHRDRACLRMLARGEDPELLRGVRRLHQELPEREKLLIQLRARTRRWASLFVVLAENQESSNAEWRLAAEAFEHDLLEPAYNSWDEEQIAEAAKELASYGPGFQQSWDSWQAHVDSRPSWLSKNRRRRA